MCASFQYNFEALPKVAKELANALSGNAVRQQSINEFPDQLSLTVLDVKQQILEGTEENGISQGMLKRLHTHEAKGRSKAAESFALPLDIAQWSLISSA